MADYWCVTENDETNELEKIYTDYYRYNRSMFLREVMRVFHGEWQIDADPVRVSFPGRIIDAAKETDFIGAKQNTLPDYFGDTFTTKESRIMFDTDERGRILSQALMDAENNTIWVIDNPWTGERITSVRKTEADGEFLTEYEYDDAGNRIIERNLRDGILERRVFFEGNTETEELYMDGQVILRAIWEDGRKVSETRVRNR
jgi:YD repeat-containing protein